MGMAVTQKGACGRCAPGSATRLANVQKEAYYLIDMTSKTLLVGQKMDVMV